ncbi:MAG: helix-turn-helix transcriptional regulator [Actinomycetes bacterium]
MLAEQNTGNSVHQLRILSGLNQREAARRIGISRSTLRSWEAHRTIPDASQLVSAVAALGDDLQDVMVARTDLIDPQHLGVLRVGDEQILVADYLGPDTTPQQFNIDLIQSYLAAVRRQRGLRPEEKVHLRAHDLSALAVVLDLTDKELQELLTTEFNLSDESARHAVRGLLAAGLVALAASGALQSSWLAQPGPATQHPSHHRANFWAGKLGPTIRGPAFWIGRGLPSELTVWKAASATEQGAHSEFIELDPEYAIEVEIAMTATTLNNSIDQFAA